jgi:tetratricopeptide (TPR) repeat protein
VEEVQQGRFDSAIPLLESILAESPDDVKARNLLGIALSGSGRREEAEVQFTKALESNPNFAPVLKNLAANEVGLGRRRDARAHLEQVLKTTPKDPMAHFWLAEIDFSEKLYTQAVANYDLSGEAYLKEPSATLRFAQSAMATKQTAAAASALEKMAPGADARTHFEAGLLLTNIDKYAAAARQFQLAPEFPDPYTAGYNLTLAYVKSQQDAEAIQTGQQLIAAGYRKAELYNLLSQAYEHVSRTQEAYESLRSATEIDPKDESNYLDLISLCLAHQNYDLALEISDIGLRVMPRSHRVLLQRGVVLAMKGRFEDAEQQFLSTTQMAPQESLPYVSLALVEMQMNKLPEAIAVLRRRRAVNSKDYVANWFLAEALSREGALPGTDAEREAVAAAEQAVRIKPGGGPPHVLLGKMLVKRGQTDRAVDQFEQALKIDPDDTSAAYQLAQLYRKKGNSKRAEELFAKVSRAKAEDRDQFTPKNLVKIMREGTQ